MNPTANDSGLTEVYRFSQSFLYFRYIDGAVACVCAIALNLLIIASINRMNRNNLKHFRGLLMALSVLDICYALASGVTTMGFVYCNGGFLVVITGLTTLGPPELSHYFYIFYIVTFNAFFILQPIIFICRYVIICLPQHVHYLEDKFMLCGAFITACIYCTLQVYCSKNSYSLTDEHPRFEVAETGEEIFKHAHFLTSKDADFRITIIESVFLNLLIFTSIGAMVYCSAKIFLFLKQNAISFTERTRKGQRKLTLALILQTLFPILTGVLPLYVTFYLVFNKVADNHILWYTMLLHVWQPAISALITIAFVTPVRRAMTGMRKAPSRIFNITSGI